MIPELGQFLLVVAFVASLAQSAVPLWGAARRDLRMMDVGANASLVQGAALILAFAVLVQAYVVSDFSVANVAANSHSAKPLLYRIAGAWGNHEGSMLLWVMVLALFGAGVALFGRALPATLKARVLSVQGMVGAAFLLFILATSNPFLRIDVPPIDGGDLNPLLQDPGLAFHPPMLYLGYVGYSVTFAFAVAALMEGRIDAAWARWVRPWALFAWSALTLGIALGSWWAYYELGWGGFWFWDPVENASLLPWLAGTALLHSAIVVERRETLKAWTVLLAIIAFAMSLLGTFIVRSGILTSVHAFANDPDRGVFVLAILTLSVGGALALFAFRAQHLKPAASFALMSRETLLLINNLLLAVLAATVLIGTLFPIFAEAAGFVASVGAPYFHLTFLPIAAVLVLLMPFGPLFAWKRADVARAARALWLAFGAALLLGILALLLIEGRPAIAAFGLFCGMWLIFGAIADLGEKAQFARAGFRAAFARLARLPRSAIGGALAHLGLGITIAGITGTAVWTTELVAAARPGDVLHVAGYDVAFEGTARALGPNYISDRATLSFHRDGDAPILLFPERRFYPVQRMATTEAAISASVSRDIYAVLGDVNEDGSFTLRIHVNPLAPWIWGGALVMALGGMLSLADRRLRIGVPARARAKVAA